MYRYLLTMVVATLAVASLSPTNPAVAAPPPPFELAKTAVNTCDGAHPYVDVFLSYYDKTSSDSVPGTPFKLSVAISWESYGNPTSDNPTGVTLGTAKGIATAAIPMIPAGLSMQSAPIKIELDSAPMGSSQALVSAVDVTGAAVPLAGAGDVPIYALCPSPAPPSTSSRFHESAKIQKMDAHVNDEMQAGYVVSNLGVTGIITYGCVDKNVTCTSGQAKLTWSAPSQKVDGYNVYGVGYSSSGVPINRVKDGSTTGTSYVLNGTNCYVVAAYSGNHVFFDSEKICAVMPPRARGAAIEVPFAGQTH